MDSSCLPLSHHRATQEELQRHPSPAAETPPLQRSPSVRAVISIGEAGRGRPRAGPIPEVEEPQRPGQEGTSGNANPASPDLGPRGPDLASLQAERDVVRGRGQGMEAGPAVGSPSFRGWGLMGCGSVRLLGVWLAVTGI